MIDGLIDILKSFFQWLVQPFTEMMQDIFCWCLQFFISLISSLVALATNFFPSYPVPHSLLSGLSTIEYILSALNWVFPLAQFVSTFTATFFMFLAYFLFAPFYRAMADFL